MPAMSLSATLTIEVSMIAMIRPSIVVSGDQDDRNAAGGNAVGLGGRRGPRPGGAPAGRYEGRDDEAPRPASACR